MADFTPSSDLSGASAWEPTKKQLEMSNARNPLNYNQQNEMRMPESEKKPWQKSPAQQQQLLQQEANKAKSSQQTAAPMGAPSNAMNMAQQVGQNLGSLGLLLQARVKQFLSGGPQMFGLQESELNTAFDPNKGTTVTSKVKANLDPTVQQKVSEQQAIKHAAQPFMTDTGEFKTFDQYMESQFGKNTQTEYMLNLLDQLHEYEDLGASNSAEARGIWDTLKTYDKDGMVTSLYKAERDYNRYFGLGETEGVEKWSGTDPSESKTLMDMIKLSQDEIKKEVENSVLSASGLFSGDFESNIKDMIDKSALRIKESRSLSARAANDFRTALQDYLKSDTEGMGAFQEERQRFKDAYAKVADDVVSELSKSDGGLAQAWFEASNEKGLRETLFEALNDPNSGMSTNQRKEIQALIGDIDRTAGGERGQLNQWLDDLQNYGYFTANGNKVVPNSDKMMRIAETIKDPNLSQEQKQARVKEVVGSIMLDEKTSIKSHLENTLKSVKIGENTEVALNSLREGMVKSLKDFFKSRTFDLVKKSLSEASGLIGDVDNTIKPEMKALYDSVMADSKVSAEEWDSMNDSQRMEIAKEVIKHNPEIVKNSAKELMAKAETEASSFDGIKTGITAELEKKAERISEYVDVTKDANGNLVLGNTGKLYNVDAELNKKMQEIPATLWRQFTANLRHVPNLVDDMKSKLRASPYIQSRINAGEDRNNVEEYLDVVAKANMYNNFFRQNASGQTNYLIIDKKGDTVWDYTKAKRYLDRLDEELPAIFSINPYEPPAPGKFPSDLAGGFWYGIAGGHNLILQSDALRKAVDMFKVNVSKSKEQIRTALTNINKEVEDYNRTKAAIGAVGTLDKRVFSPDNIFKEVLMPITKQIENGGLTAVDVSKLPPGFAPFIKKTEGNIAYLDMGEFSGIPSLTELAEGAKFTEQALPVTNEMGLAQGWTVTPGTIQGAQPEPIKRIPQYILPAPSAAPAPKTQAQVNTEKSAKDALAGSYETRGDVADLPWLPRSSGAEGHDDRARDAAAQQYLDSINAGKSHQEALVDSNAKFFSENDKALASKITSSEPKEPKETKEQKESQEPKKKKVQSIHGDRLEE